MTYKYSGIEQAPDNMGIYIEETVTATLNTVGTSYFIAEDLPKEMWLHDPEGHSSYTSGIVKFVLYNEDTPVDIYAEIDSIASGNVITVNAGFVGNGDEVTIGYYAFGITPDSMCPDASANWANSNKARPETFQSHFNMLNIKSPHNLAQLGYKFADRMFYSSFTDSEFFGSLDIVMSVNKVRGNTTADYMVDYDQAFPFVIEEIRFIVDDLNFTARPVIEWENSGQRTTFADYFGEGGATSMDMSNTTCAYKTNTTGNYIISVPVSVVCSGFRMYLQDDGLPGGSIINVEVSGWYKAKRGD